MPLVGIYAYVLLVRAVERSDGELTPAAIRQTSYGASRDGALVRGLVSRDAGARDKPVCGHPVSAVAPFRYCAVRSGLCWAVCIGMRVTATMRICGCKCGYNAGIVRLRCACTRDVAAYTMWLHVRCGCMLRDAAAR